MVGSHATIFVFLSPSIFSVCSCVQVHAKPVHSPQTRHVHKLHATKLNFIVSNWKVFHIEAVAVSSLPFSIPFPSVSLKYIRYSLRTWKWCWKRCLNMNWTLKSWWCYMSKKKSREQKWVSKFVCWKCSLNCSVYQQTVFVFKQKKMVENRKWVINNDGKCWLTLFWYAWHICLWIKS